MIEVGFKEEPEDDEPEPLEMEHIHLPVGLWCVGTLISLLCLIAEIIIHRKTDVTIARLESENPGEMVLNNAWDCSHRQLLLELWMMK